MPPFFQEVETLTPPLTAVQPGTGRLTSLIIQEAWKRRPALQEGCVSWRL